MYSMSEVRDDGGPAVLHHSRTGSGTPSLSTGFLSLMRAAISLLGFFTMAHTSMHRARMRG